MLGPGLLVAWVHPTSVTDTGITTLHGVEAPTSIARDGNGGVSRFAAGIFGETAVGGTGAPFTLAYWQTRGLQADVDIYAIQDRHHRRLGHPLVKRGGGGQEKPVPEPILPERLRR